MTTKRSLAPATAHGDDAAAVLAGAVESCKQAAEAVVAAAKAARAFPDEVNLVRAPTADTHA